MTDREALLAAIDANPEEDTPRLAYADHLEESGATAISDLEKATAEFIRMSCGKEQQKYRQGVTEGRWLEANWRRLIPSPVLYQRYKPKRKGRWMNVVFEGPRSLVEQQAGYNERFRHFVRVEFWRGFAKQVAFESPWDVDEVLPALAVDQPLLKPDLDFWPGVEPNGNIVLGYEDLGLGMHFAEGEFGPSKPINFMRHDNPPVEGAIMHSEPRMAALKARRQIYTNYARWLHRHGRAGLLKCLQELRPKITFPQGAAEPPPGTPQEAA